MAEENRNGNTELKTDDSGKQSGTGQRTEDTCTETTPKRRRRTTPTTTTDSGATSGTTEEKNRLPELATVTPEQASNGDVPTPKKAKVKRTRTKKAKNNSTFNAEQITALLMTVSAIAGNNPATSFFALSKKECEQIADPLANIIASNDAFNGLSEHSDSIALATACFMIFTPKLFMFLAYQKQQKALKDKGVKLIKGVDKNGEKGTTNTGSGANNRTTTPNSKNDGDSVLSSIPSLA